MLHPNYLSYKNKLNWEFGYFFLEIYAGRSGQCNDVVVITVYNTKVDYQNSESTYYTREFFKKLNSGSKDLAFNMDQAKKLLVENIRQKICVYYTDPFYAGEQSLVKVLDILKDIHSQYKDLV
jgi:hypothetical protein